MNSRPLRKQGLTKPGAGASCPRPYREEAQTEHVASTTLLRPSTGHRSMAIVD